MTRFQRLFSQLNDALGVGPNRLSGTGDYEHALTDGACVPYQARTEGFKPLHFLTLRV